jgi:uncharacterized protein (AIM24 family)
MATPKLLTTSPETDRVPGVIYRIEGEIGPVLHCRLDGSLGVFFEHHILLWKSLDVQINVHPMQGAIRRFIAGMQLIMSEARGVGDIAFSRDAPGQIFPIHLPPGSGVIVREHQWLAATSQITFSPHRQRGITNMLFGGNSFWLDYFENPPDAKSEGIVWVHGFGNVFTKDLQEGESIDIEPGGWLFMDGNVTMKEKLVGLRTGLVAGKDNLILNRFTGPGRVGIQSIYYHPAHATKDNIPSLTEGADS